MSDNMPEETILQSIITPELIDITDETLELGLDAITQNEIVKKLPIFDFLLAGYKTLISIRDYQFVKKILQFLYEQNKISMDDRKSWLKKIETDKSAKDIGETIIELIDKFNSVKKARMLGIIFRYQIKGEISTRDFIRIGEMINATYLDDIDYFLKTEEINLNEIGDKVDHLFSTGFLFRGGSSMGGGQYFPNKKLEHSDCGKLIYKILKKELKCL